MQSQSHRRLSVITSKHSFLSHKLDSKISLEFFEIGKVLVVDDDPFNRLAVERLFDMRGVKVGTARDGCEALKLVKEWNSKWKLILMDVNMPGMNGLKCTELLMEYWQNCMEDPIPIIALSGCASEMEKKACFDVGMLEFISKPIKIATIDYLVKKYL